MEVGSRLTLFGNPPSVISVGINEFISSLRGIWSSAFPNCPDCHQKICPSCARKYCGWLAGRVSRLLPFEEWIKTGMGLKFLRECEMKMKCEFCRTCKGKMCNECHVKLLCVNSFIYSGCDASWSPSASLSPEAAGALNSINRGVRMVVIPLFEAIAYRTYCETVEPKKVPQVRNIQSGGNSTATRDANNANLSSHLFPQQIPGLETRHLIINSNPDIEFLNQYRRNEGISKNGENLFSPELPRLQYGKDDYNKSSGTPQLLHEASNFKNYQKQFQIHTPPFGNSLGAVDCSPLKGFAPESRPPVLQGFSRSAISGQMISGAKRSRGRGRRHMPAATSSSHIGVGSQFQPITLPLDSLNLDVSGRLVGEVKRILDLLGLSCAAGEVLPSVDMASQSFNLRHFSDGKSDADKVDDAAATTVINNSTSLFSPALVGKLKEVVSSLRQGTATKSEIDSILAAAPQIPFIAQTETESNSRNLDVAARSDNQAMTVQLTAEDIQMAASAVAYDGMQFTSSATPTSPSSDKPYRRKKQRRDPNEDYSILQAAAVSSPWDYAEAYKAVMHHRMRAAKRKRTSSPWGSDAFSVSDSEQSVVSSSSSISCSSPFNPSEATDTISFAPYNGDYVHEKNFTPVVSGAADRARFQTDEESNVAALKGVTFDKSTDSWRVHLSDLETRTDVDLKYGDFVFSSSIWGPRSAKFASIWVRLFAFPNEVELCPQPLVEQLSRYVKDVFLPRGIFVEDFFNCFFPCLRQDKVFSWRGNV